MSLPAGVSSIQRVLWLDGFTLFHYFRQLVPISFPCMGQSPPLNNSALDSKTEMSHVGERPHQRTLNVIPTTGWKVTFHSDSYV